MRKKEFECDVLVIGGGPAGMMSAIFAGKSGGKVVLVEKNEKLGVKLMMTGKGRCNVTNSETDIKKLTSVFGRNGRFLYSAFNEFSTGDTVSFFEKLGVKLKTERGGRIFPDSDMALEIKKALISEMRKNKVLIFKQAEVYEIFKDEDFFTIKTKGKDRQVFIAKKIIITTGGVSYPVSGSTGDGFKWAEKMGHEIIKPKPALTPILVKENWIKELEGLSLKNVNISVYQNGKKKTERFGEAMFTDRGLSGPVVLDMSKEIGELLPSGEVEILVDFKPALDFQELNARIKKDFDKNINKNFENSLGELLPKKLIPIVVKLSEIDPYKKVNVVTKEERLRLVHILKEFRLNVSKLFGFEKAIVTSGGIKLNEVDPKTMESKIVQGLYFAGEVLDLDACTGGYNLQGCWSTGFMAGNSAGKILEEKSYE